MSDTATQESTTDRNVIDASQARIESGIAIPARVGTSKYPWAQLMTNHLADPESPHSFFQPVGTEEEARTARTSIRTSGVGYYSNRGLPYTVVSRVAAGLADPEDETSGIFGVRSWIKDVNTEDDEEDEGEED